jgi:DinB family protein
MTPPDFPAGPNVSEPGDSRRWAEWIAEIEAAPARLRAAVAGLTPANLAVRYKNWTVRQIVAHVADSHTNAFIRFKLALTEDTPTIKPYDENRWIELPDAKAGDVPVTLNYLEALHARWVQVLRGMTEADFAREYFHPEQGKKVRLGSAVGDYAWHGRHHTAQILWLREQHGWGTGTSATR